MTGAVVADGVRKRYGETLAVDGVSLSVAEGEVFGLIGPNGAGKTSLVRSLTGTTGYDGDVSILGRPPETVDRARIGLLPQAFDPPERLTVRELLSYYAGLYDESRDPDGVVGDVGLAAAGDTWYENLSGGQQRRACVGISLINDPDVLFLDEPTTGIDPAGRRSLWQVVDDLAAAGTTVFLTSHSMDEVVRLSDRVAIMVDGRIVATGSPDALIEEYGGDPRLVVRTEAGTASLTDLRYRTEATTEELTLFGVAPEDIGDAVASLDAAGVDYESFTWTEPTLEDVYLELTGDRFESQRARRRTVTGEAGQ